MTGDEASEGSDEPEYDCGHCSWSGDEPGEALDLRVCPQCLTGLREPSEVADDGRTMGPHPTRDNLMGQRGSDD